MKKTGPSKNLKDSELFTRFLEGEDWAFSALIDRYKEPLYNFLRRFLNQQDLVEDVFQETFLQLFASKDSFDVSRPLRPWLFTIAANKAKDALRRIKRTATVALGTISEPQDVSIDDVLNTMSSIEQTPYDDVTTEETAQNVRQIVSEMPENLRAILLLAYFEQFSYKQMAEMLGIPIGTVKSRLHTAVVYFAKKWETLNKQGKKL